MKTDTQPRCESGVTAFAALVSSAAQFKPIRIALRIEVVDGELDGISMAVVVEAVDPKHRLSGRAVDQRCEILGHWNCRRALVCADDRAGRRAVDEPDDRGPRATSGLKCFDPALLTNLHGNVCDAHLKRRFLMQSPKNGHEHLIRLELKPSSCVDVGPSDSWPNHLEIGVERERQEVMN